MFSGNALPTYAGPFGGLGDMGAVGPLLQLAAPFLFNSGGGNRVLGGMFSPQSLADQLRAQQLLNQGLQAQRQAAAADQAGLAQTIGGIQQLATKQPLSQADRMFHQQLAEIAATVMPYLSGFLGPDLQDALGGPRGSAAVLSQQLMQGMQTTLDPVSRRIGLSGDTAGLLTDELYSRMFGRGGALEYAGISAGEAGSLAVALQSRGLLGRATGSLSFEEQRAAVGRAAIDDATIGRLAERLPEIQEILARNERPDAGQMTAAEDRIRNTVSQLGDQRNVLSRDAALALPGAQDVLRLPDVERIQSRLESLAPAVQAMQEIFGASNKTGTMAELLEGIDQLTQGGLATMPRSEINRLVRETKVLAEKSGLGIDALMGLAGQAGQAADQLGLDRSFALTGARRAVEFGAAAKNLGLLDQPQWGAPGLPQLVLADQQLEMLAAASPAVNQMNTLLRMQDEGLLTPQAGTELAAYMDAVRAGKTSYTFQDARGQDQTRRLTDLQWPDVLQQLQAAGVDATTATAYLQDRDRSQETGRRYDTQRLGRAMQASEFYDRAGRAFGSLLVPVLEAQGVRQTLAAAGVTDEAAYRSKIDEIAATVTQTYADMAYADKNDPTKSQPRLGEAFAAGLRQAFGDAAAGQVIQQLGGEERLGRFVGTRLDVSTSLVAQGSPQLKNLQQAMLLLDPAALREAGEVSREVAVSSRVDEIVNALGESNPLRRVIRAVQQATPDTSYTSILESAANVVDVSSLRAADRGGVLDAVLDLTGSSTQLDIRDPSKQGAIDQHIIALEGLLRGGDTAKSAIEALAGTDIGQTYAEPLRAAVTAGGLQLAAEKTAKPPAGEPTGAAKTPATTRPVPAATPLTPGTDSAGLSLPPYLQGTGGLPMTASEGLSAVGQFMASPTASLMQLFSSQVQPTKTTTMGEPAQREPLDVKISGRVEMHSDGTADLHLTGQALSDSANLFTG